MKLLWVNAGFLHPTTKGGQIRTLGMLRRLHLRHEVHYMALQAPGEDEGVRRSGEYCSRVHPVEFQALDKTSWRFAGQLASGLLDPVPLAVSRYRSAKMRRQLGELLGRERFDRVVCDFLVSAVNFPRLETAVLFQHNVETMIWRRRLEHARNPAERWYLNLQARRMFAYEARVCREAAGVIAVSEVDARLMREMFGLERVGHVPTGVDLGYFARPPEVQAIPGDLIFLGSMDWAPNVDGVLYFVREILPSIRRRRPQTRLTVVGRDPAPEIRALAGEGIEVTGTVPDVRPYLWGAQVSIVPLRIGGGTRLKIYEAMAAGTATVSTQVGAEGITAEHPSTIRLADEPEAFAAHCLELLENETARSTMAQAAERLVSAHFSWESVTRQFEALLDEAVSHPTAAAS